MRRFAIVLIVLSFALTGCQPTPEANIIMPKKEPGTEAHTAANEQVAAPTSYKNSFTDKGVTVVFNATVNAPHANTFRLPKIKPVAFDNDDAALFINALFEEKEAVSLMNPLTKSQYEELYLLKLEDLHYLKQNPQEGMDIKALENQIDYYKNRMENAPESPKDIVPYPPDRLQTIGGGMALRSSANLGRDVPAVLQISIIDEASFMEFTNGPPYMDVSMSYPELVTARPRDVKMMQQDAQKLADNAMRAIGGGKYICSAYMVGVVSVNGLYDTLDDFTQQCHLFVYTEAVDGIPVTFTEKLKTAIPDELYNNVPTWSCVAICVDDNGIASIRWQGNNEIIGYEKQDAPILPFEDIIDIAKKNLVLSYAWNAEQNIDEITINTITLGYMPLLQKNNNAYNIMVPVWDFFGVAKYEREDYNANAGYDSLLTINALDGSIIDRNVGY